MAKKKKNIDKPIQNDGKENDNLNQLEVMNKPLVENLVDKNDDLIDIQHAGNKQSESLDGSDDSKEIITDEDNETVEVAFEKEVKQFDNDSESETDAEPEFEDEVDSQHETDAELKTDVDSGTEALIHDGIESSSIEILDETSGIDSDDDNHNYINPDELNVSVNEQLDDDETNEEVDDTPLMNDDNLNLGVLGRIIKKSWWVLILNSIIIGTIAALLIIEEPRTYTSEIKLAPETEDVTTGGSLSSIASSFGVDLGSLNSSDAIRPDLYPDLVQSVDFVYKLFKLPIKTIDGNIYTDYYTYLSKYQRQSWWGKAISDLKKKFQNKPVARKLPQNADADYNTTPSKVRYLSAEEEAMIETINGKINCSIDQKTFIISISVSDQDPLVAATVADSVSARIQNFITDYRTKKATKDYQYYLSLLRQAKSEYEKSCEEYAKYVDSHRDVILQAYISERDQLENDMQLKLNTYNAMITQAQQAKSKIQENTPAFTILQNAFVPVKPSGPKRMLFVFGMVFLTVFLTVLVVVVKELFRK